MQPNGPSQHTQQPIVTGTSVVAIKFKDGVVIAADNLGSMPYATILFIPSSVQG
jgi:20S proteasome subunit beta 7